MDSKKGLIMALIISLGIVGYASADGDITVSLFYTGEIINSISWGDLSDLELTQQGATDNWEAILSGVSMFSNDNLGFQLQVADIDGNGLRAESGYGIIYLKDYRPTESVESDYLLQITFPGIGGGPMPISNAFSFNYDPGSYTNQEFTFDQLVNSDPTDNPAPLGIWTDVITISITGVTGGSE